MLALGALAIGKASHSNRSKEDIVESLSNDAANLVQRIDRNLDKALEDCNRSLCTLHGVKEDVVKTTFPQFISVASSIMNIAFDDRIDAENKLKTSFDFQHKINTNTNHSFLTGTNGTLLISGIMGMGVGLATQLLYSVKLDGRIAEARTELARVRSVVEVAKLEIAKMNSITKLAITATETLKVLKAIGDGAVANLSETVATYGNDYSLFPEQEKETTWLTFKIISALNEFVNMQLLTPSGAISAKFRKFVGDVGTEFIEEHTGGNNG